MHLQFEDFIEHFKTNIHCSVPRCTMPSCHGTVPCGELKNAIVDGCAVGGLVDNVWLDSTENIVESICRHSKIAEVHFPVHVSQRSNKHSEFSGRCPGLVQRPHIPPSFPSSPSHLLKHNHLLLNDIQLQ